MRSLQPEHNLRSPAERGTLPVSTVHTPITTEQQPLDHNQRCSLRTSDGSKRRLRRHCKVRLEQRRPQWPRARVDATSNKADGDPDRKSFVEQQLLCCGRRGLALA